MRVARIVILGIPRLVVFGIPRLLSMAIFQVAVKVLEMIGQFPKMEYLCKKRLAKNPNDYIANHYLARSLRKQDKLDEAVEIYRIIPQLRSSKFFSDTLDLLWILYQAQRYDEAVAAGHDALRKLNSGPLGFEKALQDVYLGSVQGILGASYAGLGRPEEAIPHLQVACELDKAGDPEKLRQLLQQCRKEIERGLDSDSDVPTG